MATVILGGQGRPRSLAAMATNNIAVADRTKDEVSSLNPVNAQLTPMSNPSLDAPLGIVALADGSVVDR